MAHTGWLRSASENVSIRMREMRPRLQRSARGRVWGMERLNYEGDSIPAWIIESTRQTSQARPACE
jgi:hypothetical protein